MLLNEHKLSNQQAYTAVNRLHMKNEVIFYLVGCVFSLSFTSSAVIACAASTSWIALIMFLPSATGREIARRRCHRPTDQNSRGTEGKKGKGPRCGSMKLAKGAQHYHCNSVCMRVCMHVLGCVTVGVYAWVHVYRCVVHAHLLALE